MKRAMVAAAVVAALAGAGAGVRVAGAAPIAIVGAKVHVAPGKTLERATVIIDGGKIRAVGADVAVPAGAVRIEGAGKVVTAGFIEAVSGVGLVAIDLERASDDGRLPPHDSLHRDAIHAAYQARDGYDAHAVAIPVARSGGVTLVVATPSGGVVGGQSAAYSIANDVEAPLQSPAAIFAELGPGAAGAVDGSRGRAIELLREVLDDAAAYARDRAAFERNARREMVADRLDLEALGAVLRRQVPLVVSAHAEADIRAALRLAQERNLRLVIAGGTEAWRVAAALGKARVPVVLDPTDNLPDKIDATDVRDDRAAILARAGVPVAISTLGNAAGARTIRHLAGVGVAWGLTWDQGLAAVTTVPASIYGLKDRGTVAAGQVADVVVWSGDPLELTTAAETVIIGGVVQSSVSHQTRLLDRYRTLPKGDSAATSPRP